MKACPTCLRQYVDNLAACPFDGSHVEAAAGTLPAGVGRVVGTYQLVCKLGEGGMGSIFAARHTRLDRYVAIKVLKSELASSRDNITRFFDEAHIVNRIQHPNIMVSIDTVEDLVDGVYSVLELLRGRNLQKRLAGGALPIEQVIDIGAQIADALAAVHAHGVVHRDVKPENLILVDQDDRTDFVKLIDFGVAQTTTTKSGAPVGTAAYMAPEQASGERVDARADLYALGVLVFEMIAGRHPFPSTTDNEYLVRHAHDAPPKLHKLAPWPVPVGLSVIVERLLAKDPEDRYASAEDVATALRSVTAFERQRGRSRKWAWAAAAAVLAAGAGVAALVLPDVLESQASPIANAPVAPAPVAARPAEPAPAATVEPARPATPDEVTLTFTSTPPGASVYREGETSPLGTTPFSTPLLRADRTLQVRFVREGFMEKVVDVSLAETAEIKTELVAVPTPVATPVPVRHPVRPVRTTQQREGVMDPFANGRTP